MLKIFIVQIHLLYVYECWPACVYMHHMDAWVRRYQNRKLELWMVMDHHVGPGNPQS